MLACQSNCLILAKILFNAFNVHDVDYVKLVILYVPLVLFFFFFFFFGGGVGGGAVGVVKIQERPIGNYRIWISFLKTCLAFHKACQYLELLLLLLIYI